jgi:hypothetical protein
MSIRSSTSRRTMPPTARHGIRPRRSHRYAQHRQSLGGEDGVEYGGELRVSIADRKPDRPTRSSRPMSRLRACWPTHSPTGCAVPQHMDPSGGGLEYEQHLPPLQKHGIHGEAGPPPAHPRPGRGGTGARSGPTAWVPGQPRRAAASPTRYWPQSCTRGDAAHRGCGDSPRSGSPWPAAAPEPGAPAPRLDGHAGVGSSSGPLERSAQSIGGRATCRRSTATSCRNTSSSALLVAERRVSSTSHPNSWQKIS